MIEFEAAYDAVLAQWPAGTESLDVATPSGRTRVQVCGAGTPIVLLHGGGATSTAWFAAANHLADGFRVYAPDLVGDPGMSENTKLTDPPAWLDAVLTGLGLDRIVLGGHSYGGWIALTYALAHPDRVDRLVLFEPSSCFAPMAPAYLVRGLPVLLGNTPRRLQRLFDWETGGRPLDPAWMELMRATTTRKWQSPVLPKRPTEEQLRAFSQPTLVVTGGRSRSQDTARVARVAHSLLPDVTTRAVAEASHHTMPTEDADQLAAYLREFAS
ncbi:alpha/beta fold hydrolase [Cryptosporangium sp. NPDC048952]|uniref:alpha/beta fold hydrolase n=1 Tax=Cryptosporangium sp. NPDC048952 TaxID=3363961 RepID=UPI00371E8A03